MRRDPGVQTAAALLSPFEGSMSRLGSRAALRRSSLVVAVALGFSLMAAPAEALPSECSQSGLTVTCSYFVAGSHTFTVPAGVSSLHVIAAGAPGAAVFGGAIRGGVGAAVEYSAVPVSEGQSLTVWVGSPGDQGGVPGGGAGGSGAPFLHGGRGGGYSAVLSPDSTPLVVAGGGGGAGGNSSGAVGGNGDTGTGGGSGGADFPDVSGRGGGGGDGSTGGTGGAAGANGGAAGENGSFLTGGSGGNGVAGGGGGGGGYHGGGGGGGGGLLGRFAASGGGGGGGSSYGVGPSLGGSLVDSASVRIMYSIPSGDGTAPTVTVTSPADGATYLLGQSVTADYACADEAGGSGLASCVGTVADGAPLDTSSVGLKSFTATAADNAGNQTEVVHRYTVAYPFAGFFAPVDNDALNVVKAGQAVPVKFSLGADQGLGVLAGSPTSQPVQCNGSLPAEPVEQTVTAGASSLSYDPATGTYTYTWKTDKAWAGTCRQLTVTLIDGTSHSALFSFTR